MGALVPIETLGAEIKASVTAGDKALDKAEQHYLSAGIRLIEAKDRVKETPGLTWPAFLNTHCGVRRRRADELIMIADGRTTLAELRKQKAESVRASRERQKESALRSAHSAAEESPDGGQPAQSHYFANPVDGLLYKVETTDAPAQPDWRNELPESKVIVAANQNGPGPAAYRTSFTGNNEWYTPSRYVELARAVMGQIDVDPASNDHAQKTVKAVTFYTAETNGLNKEWHGKVWMNPPYSQPDIVHFIEKMIAEYESGRCTEAIVLTHNSTDTAWFDMLFKHADAICFTKGRVRFESPEGEKAAPAMGQAFTYFGPKPEEFRGVFDEVGNVVTPSPQPASFSMAA